MKKGNSVLLVIGVVIVLGIVLGITFGPKLSNFGQLSLRQTGQESRAAGLIPEAPPDIACNGTWVTVKELGTYAYNAIQNYNDNYLILTTVEPASDPNPGQRVVAREINPVSGSDTGWYRIFNHSQNSHVLVFQDGVLNLYLYRKYGPSGDKRTVYNGKYLGNQKWGDWSDTGETNIGRTGPFTVYFKGVLYRFTAEYGPRSLLQKCQQATTPTPTPQTVPQISSISPLNVGPYSGDITITGINFGSVAGKVHFILEGRIVGGTRIKSWSEAQIEACDISVPSPNKLYGVRIARSDQLVSQDYSYYVGPSSSISSPLPCPS